MKKNAKSRFDQDFSGQATLEYGDSDFIILSPGSYVTCAVTGDQISIQNLRYWNPHLQEAYRDGVIAAKRWQELKANQQI